MYCTLYWPKVFRSIMDIVSLLSSCVVGEVVVYLCCYLWLQCHCQRKTDGISGALFSGQPALLFRYTLHSLYRQDLDLEICFCHWQTWDSFKSLHCFSFSLNGASCQTWLLLLIFECEFCPEQSWNVWMWWWSKSFQPTGCWFLILNNCEDTLVKAKGCTRLDKLDDLTSTSSCIVA